VSDVQHTLSVLVENQPGVLSRVTGLFSRRGYNIESLAVGPTERTDRSRITLRVNAEEHSIDQVAKQLYKLIPVLKVNDFEADESVERELMMVRVTAAPEIRADLIALAAVFGARVADVGPTSLMFECTEHPDRLHAFEELLKPYGIKETVRTGRIALRRTLPETSRRRLQVA
jgi:acetolactate synthase I/III small subunit